MDPGTPAVGRSRAPHDREHRTETFCTAFQVAAANRPTEIALCAGGANLSWAQYAGRVERIAGGLAALGVTRGSAVALILSERPEFHLIDTAAAHLGAAPFSIHEAAPADLIAELCGAARTRVVVTEAALLDGVRAARPVGLAIERIVTIDPGDAFSTSLQELEDVREPEFDFDAAWRSVRPHDVLTLAASSRADGPALIEAVTHARVLAACRRGVPHGLPHVGRRRFEHFSQVVRAAENVPRGLVRDANALGSTRRAILHHPD